MNAVFVIAGEMSGDTHGGGLMQAMQAQNADLRFIGYGGTQMTSCKGASVVNWVEDAGVVGLWEVLRMYSWFKTKMQEALATIEREQPSAIVLIDYPGFNLRLAKTLRERGFRQPILYYISPQVWAWKKGRVKTMAKILDLVICIFPFEKAFYEKSGLKTEFTGHPMVDRVQLLREDVQRDEQLVGFFPGSRKNEVKRLLPTFLQTAQRMREKQSNLRFVISAANPSLKVLMQQLIQESTLPEAEAWIEVGTVYRLMQQVGVGAVASGTATLEAACFGLPYVLTYRVNEATYRIGRWVVDIPYLGMINILANRPIIEELIQHDCTAERLSTSLLELLQNPQQRQQVLDDLAETVATLGEGGAYQRAAAAVLELISAHPSSN